MYPQPSDYQTAIQLPNYVFRDADLRSAKVRTSPIGLPLVSGGTFALTFFLDGASGKQWVVRCFKRDMPERRKRYQVIGDYLRNAIAPYLVAAEYLDQEMLVNGERFPVVKMPRVSGQTLGLYIEKNIQSPGALQFLPDAFRAMVESMQRQGLVHGDLQHANIMVNERQQLVLIDYDGLYLPELDRFPPNERGHENFQHPARNMEYDSRLDHFSSIAIYLALQSIVAKPELWLKYSNGDNLMMTRQDFLNPDQSRLFRELETIPHLSAHVQNLRRVCKLPYVNVPDLSAFLRGQIPSASCVPEPHSGVRSQFIDATDRNVLLGHVGDIVTVVGKITGGTSGWTRVRNSTPYHFLNFGDYRQGCLTLVIWSEALDMFKQQNRNPNDLYGQWVSVTGLISAYNPGQAHRSVQPQIIVEQPSQIQILKRGETEAKELVSAKQFRTAIPITRSNEDHACQTGTPRNRKNYQDTDLALDEIYKNFTVTPPLTNPKNKQTASPSQPNATGASTKSSTVKQTPPVQKPMPPTPPAQTVAPPVVVPLHTAAHKKRNNFGILLLIVVFAVAAIVQLTRVLAKVAAR